jgi:hypothetical protein
MPSLPADPSEAVAFRRTQFAPARSIRCWREFSVLAVTVATVVQPLVGAEVPPAATLVSSV